MSRGNQRILAREKADKKNKGKKQATNMSGSEFQRLKESNADKMREKQKQADERKAAQVLAAGKPKSKIVTKPSLVS